MFPHTNELKLHPKPYVNTHMSLSLCVDGKEKKGNIVNPSVQQFRVTDKLKDKIQS